MSESDMPHKKEDNQLNAKPADPSDDGGRVRINLKLGRGRSPSAVWLETYGCTLNQADSDIMTGVLQKCGYTLVPDAEIFILNTCTVKEATENKIISRIIELKKNGKKIVVAGCLGINEERVRKADPNAVIVHPGAIARISEAVECAKRGEARKFSEIEGKAELPRIFTKPILRIPVQEGCVGNCHFCQTRIARPVLMSHSRQWVRSSVEKGVEMGAKEIQITGQDTGAYGLDIRSSLPELMREVLSVKGDFRVRLGMINPGHAKKFLPEIIEMLGNQKFYRFLHLPVQTGSEKVRAEMNRAHTVADFEFVVGKVREKFPDTAISTDIIAGYPTETKEDFERTKELLERVRPDTMNISKYSSRRGTYASTLKKLKTEEIKRRSKELSILAQKISGEKNAEYVGLEADVLVTEMQKTPTGRTQNYKQVCILGKKKVRLGEFVRVKIVDSNYGSLFGELI
jgi:threonylcarbamoyladenosine tRNA methylthiotransferase CDKAL1